MRLGAGMLALRMLLLISLLGGGLWLAFHAPWKARAEVLGLTYRVELEDAPYFQPPAAPPLSAFEGKVSPYLDPQSVAVEVYLDRPRFFSRVAGLVIGSFFLFGVAGYFVDRRPLGSDVAYSLALSGAFLASSMACLLAARVADRPGLVRWMPIFWAVGAVGALVATVLARRSIPPRRP